MKSAFSITPLWFYYGFAPCQVGDPICCIFLTLGLKQGCILKISLVPRKCPTSFWSCSHLKAKKGWGHPLATKSSFLIKKRILLYFMLMYEVWWTEFFTQLKMHTLKTEEECEIKSAAITCDAWSMFSLFIKANSWKLSSCN